MLLRILQNGILITGIYLNRGHKGEAILSSLTRSIVKVDHVVLYFFYKYNTDLLY